MPGVDAAYQAQMQQAASMGGPQQAEFMRQAQEGRQNRILEAQRALAVQSAQEDFLQRLASTNQAGQYSLGAANAERPYATQQAALQATVGQEAPADYSGLMNLVQGGQSMQRYTPQFSGQTGTDAMGSYTKLLQMLGLASGSGSGYTGGKPGAFGSFA